MPKRRSLKINHRYRRKIIRVARNAKKSPFTSDLQERLENLSNSIHAMFTKIADVVKSIPPETVEKLKHHYTRCEKVSEETLAEIKKEK